MILHFAPEVVRKEYSYSKPCEFDQYYIEKLANLHVDEAWYYYLAADCEGSGFIVGITEDGRLFAHDLGHCSCYGPLEELKTDRRNTFGTYGDLVISLGEVDDDVRRLLDLASPALVAMSKGVRA